MDIKEQEFIDTNCPICTNKDNNELCEIRKNINGEYQCINMKLVSVDGHNFNFERI